MDQKTNALVRANVVRLARANVKRQVNRGERTVVGLVMMPPEEVGNMSLFEIMMAQRHWGRLRVVKFLERNQLSERLGLETMTDRQRKIFANALTNLTWPPEGCSGSAQ